jgi:hypothetical protein
MKTLIPFTTRAIAACAAVAITLVLFNGVQSISEPQHSVLIAKNRHSKERPLAVAVLAVAKTSKELLR